MNLLLRVLLVWIASFFKPRLGLLEESRLAGLVLPNDLDLYGHMNNGRYLSFIDLGRFDLIVRTGLKTPAKQHGWKPIVAATWIKYRKPLWLFQTFELRTRIVGWTEHWFLIEQQIFRHGRLYTQAMIKGVFIGPRGRVPTREVLHAMNYSGASPAISPPYSAWLEN